MTSTTAAPVADVRIEYPHPNTRPLSDEELRAVRSVPGLVLVLAQPNHRMDGAYPSGVTYVFRGDDVVAPVGLMRAENVAGRLSLYELDQSVSAEQARTAVMRLHTTKFDAANAFDLNAHTYDKALGTEVSAWNEHFDTQRHDLSFHRVDSDSGPSKTLLLLRTDGGQAGAQMLARFDGKSVGELLESNDYARVGLAAERNADRLAYRVCNWTGAKPKLRYDDVTAYCASEQDEAPPQCAVACVRSEYDVLKRYSDKSTQRLVAYYRGCVAPTDQRMLLHVTDPIQGGALYVRSSEAAQRKPVKTMPLGSELLVAGTPERVDQHNTLFYDKQRLAHVQQVYEWVGKALSSSSTANTTPASVHERLVAERWNTTKDSQQMALALGNNNITQCTVVPLRPVCVFLGAQSA